MCLIQFIIQYYFSNKYFKFRDRYVFYTQQTIDKGNIYIYLNGNLKEEERVDYLNRIAKFPERYTSDEYAIKESQMGTIALLANQTEVSAEEIYIQYKSRSEIEQYFLWSPL